MEDKSGKGRIQFGDMPSYGEASGKDMLAAVHEAIYGAGEVSFSQIDNERPLGHQHVPTINFNSLSRIITAFVNGSCAIGDVLDAPVKSGDLVIIRRDVLGAACSAIRNNRDAPETLLALKEASMSPAISTRATTPTAKSELVEALLPFTDCVVMSDGPRLIIGFETDDIAIKAAHGLEAALSSIGEA